jgi:hypothetical protein
MDYISADVLHQDCNEDVLLTPVTNATSQYPFCPLNDGVFGSDLSFFSTSSQDFDPSILPLSATQAMGWSSPSPLLLADSALSYFLPNHQKDLTTTGFDFDKPSQPPSFNTCGSSQSPPQILARSHTPISPNSPSKNPAIIKAKLNRPLLPSEATTSLHKSPSSHTTTSTDTSDLSSPNSPHKSHDPGPSSNTEKRVSRRRAQNCAAQRAFRARKEKTIKESSQSLEVLKIEHQRLQDDNINICSTVENLQSIIKDLRQERGDLSEAGVDQRSFGSVPSDASCCGDDLT